MTRNKPKSLWKKIKKNWHLSALTILSLTILISHTLYSIKTFQHPKWDEHIFLGQAIMAYDVLKSPSPDALKTLSEIFIARPPLYGFSLALPLLLFGTSATYKVALWINVIFYIATVVGIYFLAKRFLSKTSSLLASIIFAFYGFPLFYLHFVYSETATTAFVVLTLLFLAKSENFSDRKNILFFALFFALGNITRWVTPIFTAGAIAVVFGKSVYLHYKTKNLKKFGLNLLLFLLIGVGVPFLIYYLPNLSHLSHYVSTNAGKAPEWVESLTYLPKGLSNPFSVHSIMFYFNILSQQTIFFFLLFCIGFLISTIKFKKYMFLLASLVIPYLFFTFASVLKDDRYIVPIYPFMAIISAVTFEYIKNKKLKFLLIGITILLSGLNFLGASWGTGPLGKQGLKDIVLPEFIRHPRRIYLTTMVWPPIKDVTKARTIVKIVEEHKSGKNQTPYVLNTYTINPLELDVALTSIAQFEKRGVFTAGNLRVIDPGDYNELFSRINASYFLIVKTKKTSIDDTKYTTYDTDQMIKAFNKALELSEGKLPDAFEKIDTVFYPLDKIQLNIYEKKRDITGEEWQEIASLLANVDPKNEKKITQAVAAITK